MSDSEDYWTSYESCSQSKHSCNKNQVIEERHLPPTLSTNLTPLTHQVGGHGLFFKYKLTQSHPQSTSSERTSHKVVLKIFHHQEKLFYEIVSKKYPNLLHFLPIYYGTADLSYVPPQLEEDSGTITPESSGSHSETQIQPEEYEKTDSPISTIKFETFSIPQYGTAFSSQASFEEDHDDHSISISDLSKNLDENQSPKATLIYHPWSKLLMYKDRQRKDTFSEITSVKLKDEPNFQSHKQQKFLILEDLTAKMKKPCIADIKMGRRHYGLYTSIEKRRKQSEKALNTTSASLAIRLCGMQVYKNTLGKYIFLSKYEGRKLTSEQLKEALTCFLSNGVVVHTDLIDPLIEKLATLRLLMLEDLVHFRMYASSILLLYDGAGPIDDVKVKLIDFEHCYAEHNDDKYLEFDKEEFIPGPDYDYSDGVSNLMEIFSNIRREVGSIDKEKDLFVNKGAS